MSVAVDELLLSAAEVEIQASGKPPSVTIVAYTGGLMSVPGWGPVVIDLSSLDRSAPQISILADHNASLGWDRRIRSGGHPGWQTCRHWLACFSN